MSESDDLESEYTDPLHDLFERYNDDFLKFDRVQNKRSTRADLHAFLLLDELFPGSKHDMVSAAEHDEIYLDPTASDLLEAATTDQIIELIRCGVRYDESIESLCMFV